MRITYDLVFSKTFITGTLAGLTVEGRIPHATREGAKMDAQSLRRTEARSETRSDLWTGAQWFPSNIHIVETSRAE